MIILRIWWMMALGGVFFLAIVFLNAYFVYTVMEEDIKSDDKPQSYLLHLRSFNEIQENIIVQPAKKKGNYYVFYDVSQLVASTRAELKIRKVAGQLTQDFQSESSEYKKVVKKVMNDLKLRNNNSVKLWKTAEEWVNGMQVLPKDAPLLGSVLNSLCSLKILKADNSKRGTQLKLMLTLESGQLALFKPQWKVAIGLHLDMYSRNEIVRGSVYAGRDRHNGEVAAFYLSLLLDMRKVPLTVGRKVNLKKEIMPVASQELLNTFYQDENNTCFYGVCVYCEPNSSVCANGDIIEGALINWLPPYIKFQSVPNPWRRTYKKNLAAIWEVDETYCEKIKSTKEFNPKFSPRLLDLIDAAIFDFLLDNGDRHHYEIPAELYPSTIFLFDNGKSFGNPHADHLDILAPLYQCCIIRKTTWERLKMFSGGALGSSLEKILRYSHISPVLTVSHLAAIDRRLFLVYATVKTCIREKGMKNVFL